MWWNLLNRVESNTLKSIFILDNYTNVCVRFIGYIDIYFTLCTLFIIVCTVFITIFLICKSLWEASGKWLTVNFPVMFSSGLSHMQNAYVLVWPSCTVKLSVQSQTWRMDVILLPASATPPDIPDWSCHVRTTRFIILKTSNTAEDLKSECHTSCLGHISP